MKKKVSLVLSGGGARGIAHIGVIEDLESRGYEIVSFAGTSMGALIGGIYALGKLEAYKQWILGLDKLKVFNLLDFTVSSQGLVKGDKVFQKMKAFIPDGNIENLPVSYVAVATDVVNNKEVIFTKGSVFDAIRASVAIPTVFTPVKTEGGLLVDGGVLNNIPVNRVKRFPGDILIVVHVNANIPVEKPVLSKQEKDLKESVYQKKLKAFKSHLQKIAPLNHEENMGYFDLINKTINLIRNQNATLSLQRYPIDVLIEVSRYSCGTFDFFKAEEILSIGRYAATRSLEKFESRS